MATTNNRFPFPIRIGNWIEFDYVNYKGEKSHRRVEVEGFFWGSTEYHKEEQWLLQGYDIDKQAERMFAMKDISNVDDY